MISVLQNGDEIVTNGGIIGKIIEVKDTSFIVRSAGKSNLEIGKAAVVGRKSAEEVSK
jgi:preprotein translocase YajC subunit